MPAATSPRVIVASGYHGNRADIIAALPEGSGVDVPNCAGFVTGNALSIPAAFLWPHRDHPASFDAVVHDAQARRLRLYCTVHPVPSWLQETRFPLFSAHRTLAHARRLLTATADGAEGSKKKVDGALVVRDPSRALEVRRWAPELGVAIRPSFGLWLRSHRRVEVEKVVLSALRAASDMGNAEVHLPAGVLGTEAVVRTLRAMGEPPPVVAIGVDSVKVAKRLSHLGLAGVVSRQPHKLDPAFRRERQGGPAGLRPAGVPHGLR